MVPSRSFICLRHGATDWNRLGLFQGRTDNPLNDDGIAQAHAAAEKLQTIELTHVVSSPLLRAAQTAEIIASRASKAVTLDHGLIELDFGSFEGRPVRELMTAERLITVREGASRAEAMDLLHEHKIEKLVEAPKAKIHEAHIEHDVTPVIRYESTTPAETTIQVTYENNAVDGVESRADKSDLTPDHLQE